MKRGLRSARISTYSSGAMFLLRELGVVRRERRFAHLAGDLAKRSRASAGGKGKEVTCIEASTPLWLAHFGVDIHCGHLSSPSVGLDLTIVGARGILTTAGYRIIVSEWRDSCTRRTG